MFVFEVEHYHHQLNLDDPGEPNLVMGEGREIVKVVASNFGDAERKVIEALREERPYGN